VSFDGLWPPFQEILKGPLESEHSRAAHSFIHQPHVPPIIVSTVGRLAYKKNIISIKVSRISCVSVNVFPKFDHQHAFYSMTTQKNTTYVCSCYV